MKLGAAMLANGRRVKTDEQTKIYCSHHRRGARRACCPLFILWTSGEKALVLRLARSNKSGGAGLGFKLPLLDEVVALRRPHSTLETPMIEVTPVMSAGLEVERVCSLREDLRIRQFRPSFGCLMVASG